MQPVDEKALYEFLHRILLPRGGTGKVINMTTFPAGPKQVSILLDNLRLAEQAFSSWIVPSLSRSATIDYQITSLYDVEKLTRGNLEHANDNTERLLPPEYRQGGHLEISAKSRIFKHTSLNYGFAFTVDRSKKNSVRVNSFASFRGSKFKRDEEQSGWAQSEENLTPSQVSQVFGPPLKSPPTVEHWTAILGKVVAANARLVLETKRSKDEETRKFVKEILNKC